MSTDTAKKLPGTAKMDTPWEDLGFEFRPTNSHVKLTWKEGEGWSKPELVEVRLGARVTVPLFSYVFQSTLKVDSNEAGQQKSCNAFQMLFYDFLLTILLFC